MKRGRGTITGVSVNHEHAALDAIETACADGQRSVLRSLLADGAVEEAFVLHTCNRAEAYVVTATADEGRDALSHTVAGVPDRAAVWLPHEDALEHLMRVACGLESLILGEDQIMGQLRTGYTEALDEGAIGPVLEGAITKAIHVGERARTETAINEGALSLGSAAVRLADDELGTLGERSVLVVGAGEIGTLAATAFAPAVARLAVANRTRSHAAHIARTLAPDTETVVVDMDDLPAAVADADAVVTATGSPIPLVDHALLAEAGETLVVDLAQPRDVEPAARTLPNVTLHDLDDLESVTDATADSRATAAREVEAMIDEELERLLTQFKRQRADEVIGAMYESAEGLKRRETERAIAQLEAKGDDELSAAERAVVESLADSLVGQLLAAPTKSLRDAAEEDDWSTISTALELFDPEFGDGPAPPEGVSPDSLEGVPPELRDRLPDAAADGEDD